MSRLILLSSPPTQDHANIIGFAAGIMFTVLFFVYFFKFWEAYEEQHTDQRMTINIAFHHPPPLVILTTAIHHPASVVSTTPVRNSANTRPAPLISPNRFEAILAAMNLSHQYYDDGVDEMCPICLEEFRKGELVRALPCRCKMAYHTRCIERWFCSNSLACPVCRKPVPQGQSSGTVSAANEPEVVIDVE